MTFLVIFITLSIVNVVFSTVRSLTTINSGKTVASLISGGYFAFYNVMLIYTVMDFPMWQKCIITFACNVIGVWVVKFGEEKMRKDKLWKVEATIAPEVKDSLMAMLVKEDIPVNYIDIGKYVIVNCYCATQAESAIVKKILDCFHAKYFVSESKSL